KDRLDFGGEQEPIRAGEVEQRLLPNAVSRQEQGSPASVPDGEGEHAPQPLHARATVFLPGVDDRLRVAVGSEYVSLGLEVLAQLLEVVDLSVERDPDGSVFVRHRLCGDGSKIDDGEPPVAESDVAVGPHRLTIGPAVRDRVGHGLQLGLRDTVLAIEIELADDSTHRY